MKKQLYKNIFAAAISANSIVDLSKINQIGADQYRFQSPTQQIEVCIITNPIPTIQLTDKYTDKDLKKQKKLCDINFYDNNTILCPKASSTSAATLIYQLDSDDNSNNNMPQAPTPSMSDINYKEKFQNAASCENLAKKKPVITEKPFPQKAAKYKQNEIGNLMTAINVSSLLSYYHFSKALGDVLNVPYSVIRTMDVSEHLKLADIFDFFTKKSAGTIAGWANFKKLHNGSRKLSELYSTDKKQLYGVLVKGGGTETAYDMDTMDVIQKKSFYQKVTNPSPLADQWSLPSANSNTPVSDFKKRQDLLLAKDFSDLVLLDTILEQQDRFSGGNIEKYKVYWTGNEYLSDKNYNKQIEEINNYNQTAKIKKSIPNLNPLIRISIQDNDAGLKGAARYIKQNWDRLETIRHFSPVTYQRLQIWADDVAKNKSTWMNYMTQDLLMSSAKAELVIGYILQAAGQLKQRCQNGNILLDLDEDLIFKQKLNGNDVVNFSRQQCGN